MFASVNWNNVTGAEIALITFLADVENQPPMSLTATFIANHTEVPGNFTGEPNFSYTYLIEIDVDSKIFVV